MSLKILTDSGCDLPLSFYEENNIHLFPLKVSIDQIEYDDLTGISPTELYIAQAQNKNTFTSQVSIQTFEETFTRMAQNQEDGIYISFSGALSGTCSTAQMVLKQVKETYPDFQLTIIDTKCASLGLGLVVMRAVQRLKNGQAKEEIVEGIIYDANHVEHLFTVDNLDHLAKGGRLSKTSAFFGGILNIKPLLGVADGKLVPLEKHRGKKKILKRMVELIQENGTNLNEQVITICHADCIESANELKEMIIQEFSPKEVFINSFGAVIGTHVGAGAFAVFFINDNK